MGFHFPVSLHKMTADEKSKLDEYLIALKDEVKRISSNIDNSHHTTMFDPDRSRHVYTTPYKITDGDFEQVKFLSKRYVAIIFGNIMASDGTIQPILSNTEVESYNENDVFSRNDSNSELSILEDALGPQEYSKRVISNRYSGFSESSFERQIAKYKEIRFSRVGEGFLNLINSYASEFDNVGFSKLSHNQKRSLVNHGVMILNAVHSWMQQEIFLIPETISFVYRKTEYEVKGAMVAKSRQKKLEKHDMIHTLIVDKYMELKEKNPKLSKDAASRLLEKLEGIPYSARVIARHLSKL